MPGVFVFFLNDLAASEQDAFVDCPRGIYKRSFRKSYFFLTGFFLMYPSPCGCCLAPLAGLALLTPTLHLFDVGPVLDSLLTHVFPLTQPPCVALSDCPEAGFAGGHCTEGGFGFGAGPAPMAAFKLIGFATLSVGFFFGLANLIKAAYPLTAPTATGVFGRGANDDGAIVFFFHPGRAFLISRRVHGPGGQRRRVGGRKQKQENAGGAGAPGHEPGSLLITPASGATSDARTHCVGSAGPGRRTGTPDYSTPWTSTNGQVRDGTPNKYPQSQAGLAHIHARTGHGARIAQR